MNPSLPIKLTFLILCMMLESLYAINPKAEKMANLFVQQAIRMEKMIGKNPNMDIKTYSIKNYVYHDRTEYNYNSKMIYLNKRQYIAQIESEYCVALKILKEKYDLEFIFNIFGNDNIKAFTHILICK